MLLQDSLDVTSSLSDSRRRKDYRSVDARRSRAITALVRRAMEAVMHSFTTKQRNRLDCRTCPSSVAEPASRPGGRSLVDRGVLAARYGVALGLITLLATDSWALWSSSPDSSLAVAALTGEQRAQVATTDGADGAIIAWEDLRSGSFRIYAQRMTASGAPAWPVNGIALSSVTASSPVILSDGAGGAFVGWSTGDIYVQRITSSGRVQLRPSSLRRPGRILRPTRSTDHHWPLWPRAMMAVVYR